MSIVARPVPVRHRRRRVLAAAWCMLLLARPAGAATEHRFEFDVRLDARPLGTHRFTITGDPGSAATVESEARFDVSVLGIPAYRYQHHATERWTNGCLAALDATTLDNGRKLRVVGSLRDGRFQLDQPAASGTLPACLLGYATRRYLLKKSKLASTNADERYGAFPWTKCQRRYVFQSAKLLV